MTPRLEPTRLPPADGAALRRALYAGEVFLLEANPSSSALVTRARALLEDAFGPEPRRAHERVDDAAFFAKVGAIRRVLFRDPECLRATFDVIAAQGIDPDAVAFDPPRLRVIKHLGHENPRAAAVYYPHRDTWYGHPQGLITWWLPLDDLSRQETFEIYPDRFAEPVPNDSEIFDYDAWVANGWDLRIGWQDRDAGLKAQYPGIVGPVERGRAMGFSCARGQNLLLSGSHFHATLPQASGLTRFSLDFRVVHLADHEAGLGAPNVDDRSQGCAIGDYVRFAELELGR